MLRKFLVSLGLGLMLSACCTERVIDSAEYGLTPDVADAAAVFQKMFASLQSRADTSPVTIRLPKGTYRFASENAVKRELYVSNHDQDNPKPVGILAEKLENITIDANGSIFLCRGRMLPLAILNATNCTFKNFQIDFEDPQIVQIDVVEVNANPNYIIGKVDPAAYALENGRFIRKGHGWRLPQPSSALIFDGKTHHLWYRISDAGFNPSKIEELEPGKLKFHHCYGDRLTPGARLATRGWHRPHPGIFLTHSRNTKFENVTVHYAEGMGLLAQLSENIHLDGFRIARRGDNDPRYFTTQADATHFSGCKGTIISENGLYEGMMDDAINVHGTYLKVTKRVNDNTLHGRYMHGQAWGFTWGYAGDAVQFVESSKMEIAGANKVTSIKPLHKPTEHGEKEFEIVFESPIPETVSEAGKFGIENLEWTPAVIFRNNTVRNNRARGALFSTPKPVLAENNFFDHTHGTAILLCGDCNGWYETGACRDVIIRNNRFLNALTSQYQFTNAVISIYPEIPNLKDQKQYFHSNVVIDSNLFETFDQPLVYAKSVDGLSFTNNTIKQTTDFAPYHWNKHPFFFERVSNAVISNNKFYEGFDLAKALRLNLMESNTVRVKE